jgi:negative regulator of flagellin synthesis FlgM
MKINNLQNDQKTSGVSNSAASNRATPAGKAEGNGVGPVDNVAAPAASATVTLSSTATNLLSSADPTFDADKVARIKEAIDNGTFKANPEAIADKLISNARELMPAPAAH